MISSMCLYRTGPSSVLLLPLDNGVARSSTGHSGVGSTTRLVGVVGEADDVRAAVRVLVASPSGIFSLAGGVDEGA